MGRLLQLEASALGAELLDARSLLPRRSGNSAGETGRLPGTNRSAKTKLLGRGERLLTLDKVGNDCDDSTLNSVAVCLISSQARHTQYKTEVDTETSRNSGRFFPKVLAAP